MDTLNSHCLADEKCSMFDDGMGGGGLPAALAQQSCWEPFSQNLAFSFNQTH